MGRVVGRKGSKMRSLLKMSAGTRPEHVPVCKSSTWFMSHRHIPSSEAPGTTWVTPGAAWVTPPGWVAPGAIWGVTTGAIGAAPGAIWGVNPGPIWAAPGTAWGTPGWGSSRGQLGALAPQSRVHPHRWWSLRRAHAPLRAEMHPACNSPMGHQLYHRLGQRHVVAVCETQTQTQAQTSQLVPLSSTASSRHTSRSLRTRSLSTCCTAAGMFSTLLDSLSSLLARWILFRANSYNYTRRSKERTRNRRRRENGKWRDREIH